MKWDIKVFVVFVFVVLLYGGSYFFDVGKFAFPIFYVDLLIAGVSLLFFVKTPFSIYSLLKVSLAISLSYLLFEDLEAGVNIMEITESYRLIRAVTIFLFAAFLIIRVFRNKNLEFRGLFLFFGLVLVGQFIFNGLNVSKVDTPLVGLIESTLVLLLCLQVFRQDALGDKIMLGIKRMFILIGMYAFRSVVFLLTTGGFFD